jgi:hypothetical protein
MCFLVAHQSLLVIHFFFLGTCQLPNIVHGIYVQRNPFIFESQPSIIKSMEYIILIYVDQCGGSILDTRIVLLVYNR